MRVRVRKIARRLGELANLDLTFQGVDKDTGIEMLEFRVPLWFFVLTLATISLFISLLLKYS